MGDESAKTRKMWSVSCGVTVLMGLYLSSAMVNFYRLMYPLSAVDIASYQESELVKPLWDEASKIRMKVYLSTEKRFNLNFLDGDFAEGEKKAAIDNVVLLWEQELKSASLSKSFLLTELDCEGGNEELCSGDTSYKIAEAWLDQAERRDEGSILSELKAGEGVASTSFLLVGFETISNFITNTLSLIGLVKVKAQNETQVEAPARSRVFLPDTSLLWYKLQSNSTIYIHVVVVKMSIMDRFPAASLDEERFALSRASKTRSLLMGNVDLIKYDSPHHVQPPRRLLYKDVLYVLNSIISPGNAGYPPWDAKSSNPKDYATYMKSLEMKREGAGYPYWKPEVSIKYVNDNSKYPIEYAGASGMELARIQKSRTHPTGLAMLPSLHVDEIGLTSEKYIPVNETITSLPLRISFGRSDMRPDRAAATATAGGISPARWRLLTHVSQSLEVQKELGFEQSDIDDLRRLVADTNVALLAITVLASGLHLLFEFLTFKNEVSFWSRNKDLTGLSVRSLFLDMIGQVIILLFLIEKQSSLLMTIPAACGCLIALWKCQRGAGFRLVRLNPAKKDPPAWWNAVPALFGYEIRATRLEISNTASNADDDNDKSNATKTKDLRALTIETDRIATRTLGTVLLPFVVIYTLYSFFYEEHTGWYSWLITSASSAVYALGFVLMTPQLFLNYKLKSVAHLPWKVLIYKFLNTFIDDLFAFIIRMPTMARLSCFRDDIVFIIYLYQRWLYPVDTSRPVEGGDDGKPNEESNKTISKITSPKKKAD